MKSVLLSRRQPPTPREARYARALEAAPGLVAALNDASQSELELRGEVGLARTMLEQVLHDVGEMHGKTGQLNPLLVGSVQTMLQQVQSLVGSAAAIEAKRADQKISATHLLTLLVGLRDDLKRRLNMAYGEQAADIVEQAFLNARWTGGLKDEDVADALLQPAAFDLMLRTVDREGDALKEAAKARGLNSPELLALAAEASVVEQLDPLAVQPESLETGSGVDLAGSPDDPE